MIPTRFPNSNMTMHAPDCNGQCSDPRCLCVAAYRDERYAITCWQPTPEERVRIAQGEPIWLICHGGMFPSQLTVETPFPEQSLPRIEE